MKISVRSHAVPKGSRRGTKLQSEDAFCHNDPNERPFIAAVADGHGDSKQNVSTSELAALVARMLCDRKILDVAALCDIIQETIEDDFAACKSGAVATRVLIDEGGFQVMCVGDVRLYRFIPEGEGDFEQITIDHHPGNPAECERLEPLLYHPQMNPKGKYLFFPIGSEHPTRIMGGSCAIMVTRSFGDPEMRPALISDPGVCFAPLDTNVRHVFALCSDGGADIVERAFVAARELSFASLEEFLHLVQIHTPPDPRDDVTILLIELTPDTP
ncbi:hypothetical protein A3C09_00510 [Candidatus Uhrbacteria bacterium RIFCSPHIGHO2_02_FULL_47_44]|uniref:PPM-type phosphatase domain-containing protein n=1 Tax=Candidatus Uhrbacteria bacterium RIFCSPLOWO2_02_FULL_48_18 TaxID=1802408 RepID=A0A1F7V8G1_9BACT|nr:MAG: hypothetical protein A3C09_00510 [Candidatus Uhrbacteria bacterium RIFCSPHIGHO2_02_FULL_47_44]OGL75900.1 MAG: hypothetical protein A3E97_03635 [Candidatus Uhrbacteria bacterium RIFCSPHIGHO2_12_FULL_47_12]OGL82578.1 MAG: hypothetical protein A3B20_00030 [Candidatus Uhrbacteria bacterium RIFCSPLOWO2_01_FULL_47_17]OGL86789.1 MAG: hypothetical protein A3I41_04400 [Candidatus Uhrbacteria bacterium RIFCSPLOWO2_02_FULL_48_18]OGL91775.1 MAG: hypothetical protein A3H12_00655 [Candidatus Uhrbacte